MKTYPRLAVRHRHVSVLVTIGAGHRGYELRPMWVLILVKSPLDQQEVYVGKTDDIWGWAECMDYAHATIKEARSQR